MKHTGIPTGALPAWVAALAVGTMGLTGLAARADPLHKYGNDGTWCHVDSGWLFPTQVGGLSRVLQPYNIDGNNDAGVEYRQSDIEAVVEIFAADSAATDATFDGAKSSAAGKAGETAHASAEMPFQVDARKELRGVKVTYEVKATDAHTNLYFFTTDRWRVKVLASAPGKDGDAAMNAFVQALPWSTLGTDPGIH